MCIPQSSITFFPPEYMETISLVKNKERPMERRRQERPTSCPAPRGVTLMSILTSRLTPKPNHRTRNVSSVPKPVQIARILLSISFTIANDLKVSHIGQNLDDAEDQRQYILTRQQMRKVCIQTNLYSTHSKYSYLAGQSSPSLLLLFVFQIVFPMAML